MRLGDGMRKSRFVHAIRIAVKEGHLREPFRAHDVKEVCPGFADHTYPVFLPKHRRGNPGGYTEYFERIEPGLYRLLQTDIP